MSDQDDPKSGEYVVGVSADLSLYVDAEDEEEAVERINQAIEETSSGDLGGPYLVYVRTPDGDEWTARDARERGVK